MEVTIDLRDIRRLLGPGADLKPLDTSRVESSAYEWIGLIVVERRSLMNRRKSVGDRTELCGTPLLIINDGDECPSTLTTIDRLDKKEGINLQILGVNPNDGSLAIIVVCGTIYQKLLRYQEQWQQIHHNP